MQYSLFLLPAILATSWAAQLDACVCDAPSCNPSVLDAKSNCECLNNAAMFCWYRNGQSCQMPVLRDCVNDPTGKSIGKASIQQIPNIPQVNAGLQCVEIGYCSRPTKKQTTMVATVSGTPTTVAIPAVLTPAVSASGAAAPPAPSAVAASPAKGAPSVEFTPLPPNRKRDAKLYAIRNENRWFS